MEGQIIQLQSTNKEVLDNYLYLKMLGKSVGFADFKSLLEEMKENWNIFQGLGEM